jgi:cell division transport system permease protein
MAKGSPLPLAGDGSARFLPPLVALMVFLAAIAIAVGGTIDAGLDRWDNGLRGTLTVELPAPDTTTPPDAGASQGQDPPDQLQAALDLIRRTPGVVAATPLGHAEMAKLLLPWLGSADPSLLPLPTLIDLRVTPGAFDESKLAATLAATVPGASLEQHAAWLDRFYRAARLIEIGDVGIVLLIGTIAAVAVIFTTRTGLILYAPLIDLLHLMGATDAYVARLFQRHAFRLTVQGGCIGLVMSLLVLGGFRLLVESHGDGSGDLLAQAVHLPLAADIGIVLLPVVMGLIGLVTARMTVMRALGRLP